VTGHRALLAVSGTVPRALERASYVVALQRSAIESTRNRRTDER
jgi:hypothetical protein